MSYENKKNTHYLRPPRGIFIGLNELGRFSNYPIDVNFHLQKSLEIFDKNSADKIVWSKKDQ